MDFDRVKNWLFGGAGAVALVVFYQFMQWQISVEVSKQLSALDIGTDAKIISMDKDIALNRRAGEQNAKDIVQVRDRAECAFAVMLGRDC